MKKSTTKKEKKPDNRRVGVDRVQVTRLMCAPSTGAFGQPCYKIEGKDDNPTIGGVDLEKIIGFALYEGAVVDVAVRLVHQGVPKPNPWHDGTRGRPPKPKKPEIPKWQR